MSISAAFMRAGRRVQRIYRVNRNSAARRWLLRRMPKSSIVAEIGVWKGDFSKLILGWVQPRELHLIDPWTFQSEFPQTIYGGAKAKSQGDMDLLFQSVVEKFKGESRIHIHRQTSEKAASQFEDDFFD